MIMDNMLAARGQTGEDESLEQRVREKTQVEYDW